MTTLELTQALLKTVADGKTTTEALRAHSKALLKLTDSTGFFMRIAGEEIFFGELPDNELIKKTIAEANKNQELVIWKSSCLKETLRLTETDPKAAGAFAIPLSPGYEDLLIWFRPELVQEIKWGEMPKNHCRQWTKADEESAQYLLFNFAQGIFAKVDALSTAYRELEKASKAKDEFISLVSHELRTPLSVIMGWTDILKDFPHVDPQVVEAIQVIDRNAKLQLGLINDLLGGTIKARSAGPGQTVEVKPVKFRSSQSHLLDQMHVLIAEDQPDSANALKYLLEKNGAVVLLAADGQKAFDFLNRQKFDLILSDIGMPELDGHELLSKWRRVEIERQITQTPAIALTALAGSKDRVKALEAGFQNHIAKPVDRDELLAVIQSLRIKPAQI